VSRQTQTETVEIHTVSHTYRYR